MKITATVTENMPYALILTKILTSFGIVSGNTTSVTPMGASSRLQKCVSTSLPLAAFTSSYTKSDISVWYAQHAPTSITRDATRPR